MPRKYHRRSKISGLIGFFLFLPVLAALGFGVVRILPQVLSSKVGQFDRYNLVIAGPTISLVSLDLTNKSAVVVNFPNDLYIKEVARGYGQYKISSVFAAGELDHRGGEVLSGTVREYLGVPVDAYLYSPKAYTTAKNLFLSPGFFLETKTNLGLYDRIQLAMAVSGTRFDRVKTIDLNEFASSLLLADGSKALFLDSVEVDNILSGFLTESRVQGENFRIEVANSTKKVGLGGRAVRLLSNIGLSVVNVESADTLIPNCKVSAEEDALKSLTVARIAQIYSCKIEKKAGMGRAAVTVYLGQDYADWLEK